MESTGPIRPNIISRWTKYQAQEHPEQYDLDDGIVVASVKKNKPKPNLRIDETELYGDSIVITKSDNDGKDKKPKQEAPKKNSNQKFYPRVKVELFMESLCPDTHRFVKGPLSKVAHDPSIMEVVDLHMYIFGKGSLVQADPPQYTCQHGPAECYGNLVENCFIKYTNPGDAVDALTCLHGKLKFDDNAIMECSKKLEDPETIQSNVINCVKGEGHYLLQKAYDKTPSKLSYVPSMRINKGNVVPASNNLKEVICNEWKGDKPLTCP